MSKPIISVVYNPFFDAKKIAAQIDLLQQAALSVNLCINFVAADNVDARLDVDMPSSLAHKVLMLEKNVCLAQALAQRKHRLYNAPQAIAVCDHKGETHLAVKATGLKQIPTFIGPMTFGLGSIKPASGFISQIENECKYPMVIKEVYGSFGRQVYLVKDRQALLTLFNQINGRQVIAQPFMAYRSGQSVRVIVINNRVVGSILQTNEHDFRSNLTQHASGVPFALSQQQRSDAIKISRALNLFYGGLDFVFANNDELVFCEANSNVQLSLASQVLRQNLGAHLLQAIAEDQTYGN